MTALGTLPTLFLLCLGLWALTNLNQAAQNKNLPSCTFIHLIKMTLVAALTVIPIVIMISYAFTSTDGLELVYFVYYGFSATNWLINLYILRKQYNKIGYTSSDLRAFWVIDLIFQTIFIFLTNNDLTTPINTYKIQNFSRTGCLLFLVIFSCFAVKDSPNAVIEDHTGDYARSAVSRPSNVLDRFKISLFGRASSVQAYTNKELSPDPEEIMIDPIGLSPYKRSLFEDIEEIGIPGFEDILRNGQTTTVFKVLYLMNKGTTQTRRSYSEFYRLYTKTKGRYPGELLPVFPAKLSERESRKEKTIKERRKKLEDFLKYICQNKLYTPELFEFLKEEHELPIFINHIERDSVKGNSIVSPFLRSIGNASDLNSKNSRTEESKSKSSLSLSRRGDKSLSFNQPLDESLTKSFLEDSESSKSHHTNRSNKRSF